MTTPSSLMAVEPPGPTCQHCQARVPYRRAKFILCYGFSCLECLAKVIAG